MKPVDPTKLDKLLQRKPILMLNAIELAANFVETIVKRSPGLITTKKGKKTLPLELWLEILEWTRGWSWHVLVQPQRLEEGSTNIIICAEIPEWKPCGYLKGDDAVTVYESYLERPGDGPDENRPFLLPQDLAEDSTWKIPATALGQEDMILCGDLTVPDVIAWMEDGKCGICWNGRVICASCRDGGRISESFFFDRAANCPHHIMCPLCMGLAYAARDRWLTDDRNEGKEGYLTDEEFDAWVQSRYRELGY